MWIKLDDQFPDHPKVLQAGPLAGWLHVCGLCYAGRYLTDGFIPNAVINKLAIFEKIGVTDWESEVAAGGHDVTVPELVDRLIDAGLWEPAEGGYNIHDYLEYNPSRAEVLKTREENARRQDRWQAKKKAKREEEQSNAVNNASHNDVNNASLTALPSPSPSPLGLKDTTLGERESAPPQGYPIDTPCIPSSPAASPEPAVKEPPARGAPPPEPPKRGKASKPKEPVPDGVVRFHEILGRYPPKILYARVDAVMRFRDDAALLTECAAEWRARGHNPENYDWLFEWYKEGCIQPKAHGRNGANSPNGGRRRDAVDVLNEWDEKGVNLGNLH